MEWVILISLSTLFSCQLFLTIQDFKSGINRQQVGISFLIEFFLNALEEDGSQEEEEIHTSYFQFGIEEKVDWKSEGF